MSEAIDEDLRLLAAIAYGEASVANDSDEIGGIAFAVANRCRAWGGKSVSQSDRNYAYAWNGTNERFNALMSAPDDKLDADPGMRLAVEWARKALANEGSDPSNGAFWWDGRDFMTAYASHPKVKDTFKWGAPSHNIFEVQENPGEFVTRWRVLNKKTGKTVAGAERGRYDSVWVSTAAHGSTIFWKYNPDFLGATGAKAHR